MPQSVFRPQMQGLGTQRFIQLHIMRDTMLCLYIRHAEFWTPVLLKTESGRAAAAFTTRELATSFIAQIGFPDPVEIIAAERLGTAENPFPQNWGEIRDAVLFDSSAVLESYFRDREAFPADEHLVTLPARNA